VVSFKKEHEEQKDEEDEEGLEEPETEEGVEPAEEDVAKEEGEEGWIRSGDEVADRKNVPEKHSLEIDIRMEDKWGKEKGKFHMFSFAGVDDRLYINEMVCENDLQNGENKSLIHFDDLSDPMQDRIYDWLDELGLDDRMAHFVKSTVAREKKESDIAFLNHFKEVLKS